MDASRPPRSTRPPAWFAWSPFARLCGTLVGCLCAAFLTADRSSGLAAESLPAVGGELVAPRGVAQAIAPLYLRRIEPLPATSCAASGCHGGPRPGVADPHVGGLSAYPLWLERDPHARAWESLCRPTGVAMMERLGILVDGQIVDSVGFNNCLACHNTALGDSHQLAGLPSQPEGVGCTACHGPAQAWVNQHYAAAWDPTTAARSGFIPNADLVTRARMCASCHVGDQDRDMNHDLIAAGHPPLRFEMASHHARLPKHWREPGEAEPARFESELWRAGAIASADAWLTLQSARVQGHTPISTWPELSAYDCGSCHQNLRLASGEALSDPQARGAAKMASWDLAPLTFLAHGLASTPPTTPHPTSRISSAEWLELLESLRRELEVMRVPDRDQIVPLANALRDSLPQLATAASGRASAPSRVPSQIDLLTFAREQSDPSRSWESAAQFYLLLAASRYEWPQPRAAELTERASSIRLGLVLPPGLDSPRFPHPIPRESVDPRAAWNHHVEHFLVTLKAASETHRTPRSSVTTQPIHYRAVTLDATDPISPRARSSIPASPVPPSGPNDDQVP